MLWFLKYFCRKIQQTNWRFWLKKAKLCIIITLVFKKNANFFAENCRKSQKIVIITLTPGPTSASNWKRPNGLGRNRPPASIHRSSSTGSVSRTRSEAGLPDGIFYKIPILVSFRRPRNASLWYNCTTVFNFHDNLVKVYGRSVFFEGIS
jgi:uncharacterized Zn-finger protein